MRAGTARPVSSRSSLLIWPAVIAGFGVAGVLAGFWQKWLLSGVLLLLFLLTLSARLWAGAAGRKLDIRLTEQGGAAGMFPGEQTTFRLTLKNRKLLPLLWAELFMPLPEDLCALPEQTRPAEDWERVPLEELGAAQTQVGETVLPAARWYGSSEATVRVKAQRRGLWSTRGWSLRTGDGLGLCQVELPLPRLQTAEYAVYPALQSVRTEYFRRPCWNADTGSGGTLEDVTVIRTTRDYAPGDSARQINWRLAARGLPLTVNLYEEIQPRSVHFVLDGESFSGPDPQPEALEEALSLLASLLCSLGEQGLQCGLSLCRGARTAPVNFSGGLHGSAEQGDSTGADTERMLWYLAAYNPMPPKRTQDNTKTLRQEPEFSEEGLLACLGDCGRGYYIARSYETIPAQLLAPLAEVDAVLLLWDTEGADPAFPVLALQELKGGGL